MISSGLSRKSKSLERPNNPRLQSGVLGPPSPHPRFLDVLVPALHPIMAVYTDCLQIVQQALNLLYFSDGC